MLWNRMNRRWRIGTSVAGTILLLVELGVSLPGCGDLAARNDGGKANDVPATGSVFVPTVESVAVRGENFVEHIELPGVSVIGMESTPLYAKVGGFVKEIRRVGRTTIDRRAVQITDTLDQQTYRMRDIEFRVVGSVPQDSRKSVILATNLDDLKAKWPKLYETYNKTEMMAIDIGSRVEAGTLLSVLDIPEVADGLKKQQAVIERTKQTVAQKDAAIRAATAHVGQADAEFSKAKKARDEVAAKLARDRKELNRIERLGRNVDRSLLEEVQFKVAAVTAALASADEQIKSAAENIKVAKAAVDQAKADKNVAAAQVTEANAELARLVTLQDYAFIRAPFSGTITRRFVDHGAFVQPAQGNSSAKPLFAITQTDKVRVVISVPGRNSYKVLKGQEAVLHTIGGLPGATVKGTITRSANTLDPASRMMRVEMYLKNPAINSQLIRDGRAWKSRPKREGGNHPQETVFIQPGMFGVVTVQRKWQQLRMVPGTALAGEGDGHYLLEIVAGSDGTSRVVKRFVTVVFNDAKTVGISDGIMVGARIVATGVAQLKDGQKVLQKNE